MKTLLCLLMFFSILVPACFGQGEKGKAKSDADVIESLGRTDREVVNAAICEVLKREERIIPLLLAMKGDKRPFYGQLANDTTFTVPAYPSSLDEGVNAKLAKQGKLVTVEVAAIYLISAVYHKSLNIALSPYLTDESLPDHERRAVNTDELVGRAWTALDAWAVKYRTVGLEKLRKSKDAPLGESTVDFL